MLGGEGRTLMLGGEGRMSAMLNRAIPCPRRKKGRFTPDTAAAVPAEDRDGIAGG